MEKITDLFSQLPQSFLNTFKKLNLTQLDAALFYDWTAMGVFNLDNDKLIPYLNMFKKLQSVLPVSEIPQIPNVMYRGLIIPKPRIYALYKTNQKIVLDPRIITSWSATLRGVKQYTKPIEDTKEGIIIKTKDVDNTIIYINPNLISFLNAPFVVNNHEVIVAGNGILKIGKSNIQKI